MPVIFIDSTTRASIRAMIERARDQPIPWDSLKTAAIATDTKTLLLSERVPGAKRPATPEMMMIGDFRIALSFEVQPAGLTRHLSISYDEDRVPPSTAVALIAREFGFDTVPHASGPRVQPPLLKPARVWLEEFSPGVFAFNIVGIEP